MTRLEMLRSAPLIACLVLCTACLPKLEDENGEWDPLARQPWETMIEDAPEPSSKDLAEAAADSRCEPKKVVGFARSGAVDELKACLLTGSDPWTVVAPDASRRDPEPWQLPGTSILHLAAERGHRDVVRLLLKEFGVSPNWGGGKYDVPLIAALRGGHLATAELLLDSGADAQRWTAGGMTPLLAALHARDRADLLKLVLSQPGVDPNAMTAWDILTPLEIALNHRKWEHAALLIEAGACVTPKAHHHARRVVETQESPHLPRLGLVVERNQSRPCRPYESDHSWTREIDDADVTIVTSR